MCFMIEVLVSFHIHADSMPTGTPIGLIFHAFIHVTQIYQVKICARTCVRRAKVQQTVQFINDMALTWPLDFNIMEGK